MNKRILLITTLLISVALQAQTPEDALRYSYYPQNGTARSMAIGGAMTSLGGDLTALYTNPAGLGFFKTGEYLMTPGFLLNNNSNTFRDSKNKNKKNSFGFGPTGFVLGSPSRWNSKNSKAFALGVTQTANFNNTLQYQGLNNYSSFTEQWAEQVAKSRLTIDQVLNNQQYAFGAAPALYTYLVDTVRVGGALQVRGAPENILDAGQAIRQQLTQQTRGGVYELALGYAHNANDKWYWGVTVGVPIVYYNSKTNFQEFDTSARTNNGFKQFNYDDELTTTGVGLNGKIGVIYRPKEYIRVGLSVHTPSFMSLNDKRNSRLSADIEPPQTTNSVISSLFTGNKPWENNYTQRTPWKAAISASYVFREVQNVQRQRAFVTADIEYVHHRGSRFGSDNETNTPPSEDEKNYYKALNNVIKGEYKGAFNFKLGGELKFNIFMARLGFAYYSNPYKDKELKANRMLLSGGLGYRHKGVFIDVTYVHAINKDVHFPYRLEDRANTFATSKNQVGNVVATLGVKF
jgi:hypothetical protein